MGLSVSLSNALSGMNTTQSGLGVLSRNVSNAGTPGYHSQSLNVVDAEGSNSSFARIAGIDRAFSTSLQRQYNESISDASYNNIRLDFMERMQTYLGLPGEQGSLDSAYTDFENSLRSLATSPDNYAVRAEVLNEAQNMAQSLNSLSSKAQDLRQETELQIGEKVGELNTMLGSLESVNAKLSDQGIDDISRATLSDERDRLVAGISEVIDVRADYRNDGTVALMTNSGLGLMDVTASTLSFSSGGNLGPNSLFNVDSSESGVGQLILRGPSGGQTDLVQQGLLSSGSLGALVELRDEILPQFQSQLDAIAASMATALNTIETSGTAATVGVAEGFQLDLADAAVGNSFTLNYTESGADHTIRVTRVDDATKLPMDFVAEDGVRVVGIDFSSGIAAVATDLSTVLGAGFAIDNPSGDILRIVDDGVTANTDVSSMTSSTTVSANQGAGLALNLFKDVGNASFTGSFDGDTQQRGFASRIKVSEDILSDNSLLVQFTSGGSLGNSDRAEYLVNQLEDMQFTSNRQLLPEAGGYALSGGVQDLIVQSLNFQGSQVAAAQSQQSTSSLSLEAVETRMDSEYGVNIDEEMARLLELQNAYSANARIVSIVQELLDVLMRI